MKAKIVIGYLLTRSAISVKIKLSSSLPSEEVSLETNALNGSKKKCCIPSNKYCSSIATRISSQSLDPALSYKEIFPLNLFNVFLSRSSQYTLSGFKKLVLASFEATCLSVFIGCASRSYTPTFLP